MATEYPLTYNSHQSLIALGATLIALTVVVAALRIISFVKYYRKLELASILLVPAFILTLGLGATVVAGTTHGILGYHSNPNDTKLFAQINQLEYGFWMCSALAVGLIKLSVLFFFRRVFKGNGSRTAFDYANWTLITITGLWTVGFTLASILLCGTDPAASWTTDFWIEQKCVNTYALYLSNSVTNFCLDLAVVIEPLVMVSGLQMSTSKKIQASLVFLISAFVVVAGLMKMVFWILMNNGKHSRLLYHSIGLSYPITDLQPLVSIAIFWTYIEVAVGFIVACLLPSAKLLDAMVNSAGLRRLRSLTSLASLGSKKSSRSASKDVGANKAIDPVIVEQRQWSVESTSRADLSPQSDWKSNFAGFNSLELVPSSIKKASVSSSVGHALQ